MTNVISAQGEDRSDFQPVLPWTGLDFGFAKATEGTKWTGLTFGPNWKNMKAEGVIRGAYHFLHPGEDPVVQARHFISVVKAHGLEPGDMLVVDSELMAGVPLSARAHVMPNEASLFATATAADKATKAFLDEVAKLVNPAEHPLIVYTMHAVGQHLIETAKAYPLLWFAWPSLTAPPPDMILPWKTPPGWRFWQWGTKGGIDADAYDGTKDDLDAWLKGYLGLPRVERVIIADGIESLRGYCRAHGDDVLAALIRTAGQLAQPALNAYVDEGDLTAPLPAGIELWLEVNP